MHELLKSEDKYHAKYIADILEVLRDQPVPSEGGIEMTVAISWLQKYFPLLTITWYSTRDPSGIMFYHRGAKNQFLKLSMLGHNGHNLIVLEK